MIVIKTLKTMFTKPLILLMGLTIGFLPFVFAVALEGVVDENRVYVGVSTFFTIIFTLAFVGPLSVYIYQVCDDNLSSGWFRLGLLEKTFKIVPIILLTKIIVPFTTGMGFAANIFFGAQSTFAVLAVIMIATVFEAVSKIAVASTDGYTNALDSAINVTKGIYIKVIVITLILMFVQMALIPQDDTTYEVRAYNENTDSLEYATDYEQVSKDIIRGEDNFRRANTLPWLVYGLFKAMSDIFVLTYCAHHFVEDKQITDAAMRRLNRDYT